MPARLAKLAEMIANEGDLRVPLVAPPKGKSIEDVECRRLRIYACCAQDTKLKRAIDNRPYDAVCLLT